MPELSKLLGLDLSNYEPVIAKTNPNTGPPTNNLEPGLNAYLRCPLPPIWSTTPDSLRQYYQNNIVPQVRLFNPSSTIIGAGTTTQNTFVSGSSSSSGGSSTSSNVIITQTSIKTPSLNPNNKFVGSFTLSKSFQLLNITSSAPARIQLYGTSLAQSSDLSRGLDVPLPAGNMQNVICDIALDTSPFIWGFQDRVGSNGDNPITSKIYVTITNLDVTTDTINVTFTYTQLVN